tara:strand:- start:301 stop:1443 length:1143 start_codon:yes stop_codon:yes gene_type:complete
LEKKNIYYWSPFLTEIATTKAVINSAFSINRYSKEYKAYILDASGEFSEKKEELEEKNLKTICLHKFKYIHLLPKLGKISSRFSFIIIFIMSFFKLKKIIKIQKPKYLIIHLITSLPLFLFMLFNFKTKCILRISGYPHLGFIRIFFWKIFLQKIHKITCPTLATYNRFKMLKIVPDEKIFFLPDPIINVAEVSKLKQEKTVMNYNNYLIAIGRLTKQKNFSFLIDTFKKLNLLEHNLKLVIFGNGEQKKILQKQIYDLSLEKKIEIVPFKKNIYPYLKNAKCFILSSLWEDPGFVLLESAFCRTFIISSDCKNGPDEIIKKNKAGLIYETSNETDFLLKYKQFQELNQSEKLTIKKNALIASKKFTIFNHFLFMKKILI